MAAGVEPSCGSGHFPTGVESGMAGIEKEEGSADWRDAPIRSTRSIQTPYGEQDENGTDLSLIRWLLTLPPDERLKCGDRSRENALELLNCGRRQRGEKLATEVR